MELRSSKSTKLFCPSTIGTVPLQQQNTGAVPWYPGTEASCKAVEKRSRRAFSLRTLCMSDWVYDREWATFERRSTKRSKARRTRQRIGPYSSQHVRLRSAVQQANNTSTAVSERKSTGTEVAEVTQKCKRPGKKKINRLHTFHRHAFGAWKDSKFCPRDGWTKQSRRRDGGVLLKEEYWQHVMQAIEADKSSEYQPPSFTDHDDSSSCGTSSQGTQCAPMASLEAHNILAKLWPVSHIVHGLLVSKWLRAELLSTVEELSLSSLRKSIGPKDDMLSAARRKRASNPRDITELVAAFSAVCAVHVTYAKEGNHDARGAFHRRSSDTSVSEPSRRMEVLVSVMRLGGRLVSLNLRGNSLWRLGQAVSVLELLRCCTNLQHLNLAHNGLSRSVLLQALTVALHGVGASLKHLDLSANSFNSSAADSLALGIRQCTALTFLSLESSSTCNTLGRAGATTLAPALQQCCRLQHVELGNQQVQDGAIAIASALSSCESLAYLGLASNAIMTQHAIALIPLLASLPVALNLSANARVDMFPFIKQLEEYNVQWEGLWLRGAGTGSYVWGHQRTVAARVQQQQVPPANTNPSPTPPARKLHLRLKLLDLGDLRATENNRHLDANATSSYPSVLSRQLTHCLSFANLHDLSLSSVTICSHSAASLAALVKTCNALQRLDLSSCRLGPAFSQADSDSHFNLKLLAEGLGDLPVLRSLDLGGNMLGPQLMSLLAEELLRASSLQELSLRDNQIGDQGAAAASTLLEFCAPLQSLSLRCNGIGPEGIASVEEAVARRAQIGVGNGVHLDVRANQSGTWHPRRLLRLLASGALASLDISAGDYRGPKKHRQEPLACWLFNVKRWAYLETLVEGRMREARAQGLRVFED